MNAARHETGDRPRIPALVNPAAGSVTNILEIVQADPRVQVELVMPANLTQTVSRHVAAGARRILVAGGDGTLAAAATALINKSVVLGVIPGGTLNHFARTLNMPLEPKAALEVALAGDTTKVDVGLVNDRLFLNTSSVGVYISFVRNRERWRPWLAYAGATLVSALRTMARLRSFTCGLEIHGVATSFETPLIFLAVGEREFALPQLGERKVGGERSLHVLIVRHTTRRGLLGMALRTLVKGIPPWTLESEVVSVQVKSCRIKVPHSHRLAAVDGEIIRVHGTLDYRHVADALQVAIPSAS